MADPETLRCLVLGGGNSPERSVSLRSAAAVRDGLTDLGYEVTFLDPAEVSNEALKTAARTNQVVLPILHGEGGEDGSIQSLLETTGVPYFGSSAKACALTYDKVAFKHVLLQAGIHTPSWALIDAGNFEQVPIMRQPYVLKPITGGSSIDTFVVRRLPGPVEVIRQALGRYGSMLAEALIEGTEITVGVVGDEVLPVIEIIPPEGGEFDYENKYNGATRELCPPRHVDEDLQHEAQALALQVHRLTGCRHVSRTDMLIGPGRALYVIDTNTIPGMTSQSLLPKAAAAAGLGWLPLVERFVRLALAEQA